MSLLTRAGDLVYTFRFLKMLVTPFEKTKAYELGIIDQDGKRIKTKPVDSADEKSAYTAFHRLVFNIKRLMAKAPGGGSTIASYAAALYLVKEKLELSDSSIEKIMKESGVSPVDILAEDNKWFQLENYQLAPGVYKLQNDKIVNSSFESLCNKGDKVVVGESSFPVGEIHGLHIYEATHKRSNQQIYIAIGEIVR